MIKFWILFVVLLQSSDLWIDGKSLEISSYARISRNNAEPPAAVDTKQSNHQRPEIDNKTEILTLGAKTGHATDVDSQTEQTDTKSMSSSVGTGRSSGGGRPSIYPFPTFPLVLAPQQLQQRAKSISTYAPQQHFYNHAPESPRIVYSQSAPSQVAQDRFAPGEAVAGTLFKLKAAAAATGPGSAPQSTNINSVSIPSVSSYSPLASGQNPVGSSFNPNRIITSPASINSASIPSVSSYSPLASGQNPVGSSFNPTRVIPSPASPVYRPGFLPNSYNPNKIISASSNVDAAALPPPTDGDDNGPPSGDNDNASDDQYVPPSINDLYKFPPNNNFDATKAGAQPAPPSQVSSYLPPASGDSSGEYLGPYSPNKQPPLPPPEGPLRNQPVEAVKLSIDANSQPEAPKPYVISAADDDHPPPEDSHPPPPPYPYPSHDPHDHFTGQFGYDASPEVVFDYDPHHHDHFDYHDFHHDHHEEPPPPPPEPTTTVAPEAPAEPRVKTYSYYYLGRKLWYVPLFFTLWFCFYVAALIIKSIARHKVQVPNHWQNRRRRALIEEPHSDTLRKVNKLTYFVMNHLTNFEHKYNNKED